MRLKRAERKKAAPFRKFRTGETASAVPLRGNQGGDPLNSRSSLRRRPSGGADGEGAFSFSYSFSAWASGAELKCRAGPSHSQGNRVQARSYIGKLDAIRRRTYRVLRYGDLDAGGVEGVGGLRRLGRRGEGHHFPEFAHLGVPSINQLLRLLAHRETEVQRDEVAQTL